MSTAQSPPKSQEEEDSVMMDAASHHPPTETESDSAVPRTPPTTGADKTPFDANVLNGKEKKDSSHGEPGSAWQSKKFAEEYERAFSMLQDQQWSMSQYGDPLLK